MKLRLQTLLASEKIASSKFADVIGVNRSSISHILSGRNNPSLDFLQKVLIKFPHINPDWLLLGLGTMYRNKSQSTQSQNTSNTLPFEDLIPTTKNIELPIQVSDESNEKFQPKITDNPPENKRLDNNINDLPLEQEKSIDKVVFFYSDYTFDTYYPNKKIRE